MSLHLIKSYLIPSISAELYKHISCAITSIASPHLIPPQLQEESFSSQADAKKRYRNRVFL